MVDTRPRYGLAQDNNYCYCIRNSFANVDDWPIHVCFVSPALMMLGPGGSRTWTKSIGVNTPDVVQNLISHHGLSLIGCKPSVLGIAPFPITWNITVLEAQQILEGKQISQFRYSFSKARTRAWSMCVWTRWWCRLRRWFGLGRRLGWIVPGHIFGLLVDTTDSVLPGLVRAQLLSRCVPVRR